MSRQSRAPGQCWQICRLERESELIIILIISRIAIIIIIIYVFNKVYIAIVCIVKSNVSAGFLQLFFNDQGGSSEDIVDNMQSRFKVTT